MADLNDFLSSLKAQIAEKGASSSNTSSSAHPEPDEKAPDFMPPSPDIPKLNLPVQKSGFYQLKQLRANHYKIISLHVAGLKNKDIAEQMGVNPNMVSYTLNSPIAKDHIAQLMGEYHEIQMGSVKDKLEALGDLSILAIEDVLLNAQKDSDRLNAAKSVLEYIQEKAATTTKHEHSHEITSGEIAAMRARIQENKPENMITQEPAEDVEFVEIKEDAS